MEMQISIYWDIENCCIPKGKDGNVILNRIITCICEGFNFIGNINVVIQNKNHKRVLHLRSNEKVRFIFPDNEKQNISDQKIEKLMLSDSDNFQTFVLISGDKDFTVLLFELRYMKRVPTILIHRSDVDQELTFFPNVLFIYEDFIKDLPDLVVVPELTSAEESEISTEVALTISIICLKDKMFLFGFEVGLK
ncbi:meiosis regulator and mRNA stability factor 1-like [Physella acuta]|uniref:meiosis regulator and mRNA stability factor 1-like n=1 Tax=Physella acuta TaxID=109671 RepID=UPI0027DAFCA8|nr:meiosis regulator and mRNA stability factor 1-like [Physella acuta]